MNALDSLRLFIPELVLVIGACSALMADLFTKNKKAIGLLSLAVLVISFFLTSAPESTQNLFFGFFTLDNYTHFFRLAAIGIVGLVILISLAYNAFSPNTEGEYYSLFLFMAFALILVGATTNFLMVFIAIEFVSIISYLLVGFLKKDNYAKEAAIKYILYGSLASGIMLYGMSLLYGVTGSLEFSALSAVSGEGFGAVTAIAFTFVIAGIGFKISMAPFHMWAPDVYQAAPTPVTAFLTVAPKALGFALLLRFLTSITGSLQWEWTMLLSVLAMITMTVGNLTAIAQSNMKRFLAYSSIAQAGYILMGAVALNKTGVTAILVYLIAYAFTNLGAFVVLLSVASKTGNDEMESFTGLSKRAPILALSMVVFLLSLAGMPPLAGFVGKLLVFGSVIESGFITLAVVAAINSVIAAYYYFKVIRMMYLVEPKDETKIPSPLSLKIALLITLIGTVVLGLFPSVLINSVNTANIFFS